MPQIRNATVKLDATQTKDLGEGIVEIIVATNRLDRHGERLDIKGLNTKDYSGVVLLNHDYSALPIAKSLKLTKTADGKLVSKAQFAVEEYPIAKTVYNLIKGGYITDASIGFIPKEWNEDTSTWTKSEMVEYSIVGIGANADAKITQKAFAKVGITQKQFEKQIVDHVAKIKELTGSDNLIEKGAVADILAEPVKEELMEDFYEVCNAFCEAFMEEETPVTDFNMLLSETITILQTIVDGTYVDVDEENSMEETPMQMALAKPNVDKLKALASIYTVVAKNNELDNIAGAEDNVREHITAMKSLLTALESDLNGVSSSDTVIETKEQNITKRIKLVRAKRTLQTVDRIAELAIGEIKRNTK